MSTSLVAKSLESPSYKLSTAVFVRNGAVGWVPAEIISFDDLNRNLVEVVLSDSSCESWQLATVDLSDYPNQTLPLQEVDGYGKRVVHSDLTDLQYLHEASILYNLKERHEIQCPYTRAGSVIVAVNPFTWIDGLYSEHMRMMYSDRLVWRPTADALKGLEPHIYEVSSLAYKGLIMDRGKDQSILVSGESGSGKTETVKILMRHLATFDSLKEQMILEEEKELSHKFTMLKRKKKGGLLKRVSNNALKRVSSLKGYSSFKRTPIPQISASDTRSTCSSATSCGRGDLTERLLVPGINEMNYNAVIDRVLETNPVLEAFGNAKTVRNDNSSRFGKFIQLQFNVIDFPISRCELAGSFCETYLLEKSRVVGHEAKAGERTFHIFYQLLAAPEEIKADFWKALISTDQSSFKYVGPTKTNMIEGMTDADRFNETLAALDLIGVKGEELENLMRALCCVLQLGNISFYSVSSPEGEGCTINSADELAKLSDIFGLDEVIITQTLTTRNVTIMGEAFVKPVTVETAKGRRDAFAKAIYARVFDWLVRFMNDATSAQKNYAGATSDHKYSHVGLLDIFGFESFFTENRFEQLWLVPSLFVSVYGYA